MRYLISFLFIALFANVTLSAQCYDCNSRAFLGVYSNGISYKKAQKLNFDNENGSYVTGVIDHTAAAEADLQPFDYIFGIDEYRTNSDRSLTGILRKYESGETVTIHFYRNGKQQKKTVELGKRSDARYNLKFGR